MAKLDGKAMLEEADKSGRIYRIKSSWKKTFIFAGVLMCLLVITIPVGIWFFLIPGKARVGMTDEGFAIKWFGTRAYRWEDIEAFQPQHFNISGHGVVGALAGVAIAAKTEGLKGPLSFKLKGKKMWTQMPAHAIERSAEMAREMEQHTGLTILPEEPAKDEAPAA